MNYKALFLVAIVSVAGVLALFTQPTYGKPGLTPEETEWVETETASWATEYAIQTESAGGAETATPTATSARTTEPTATETSTGTATLTSTSVASSTVTRTPHSTNTPKATSTLNATREPGANWVWPVCGDATSRDVLTYFDHYWARRERYVPDSPLKAEGDGVGILAPYNAEACVVGETGNEWCSQIVPGRSDNSGVTEFVAQPGSISAAPDGAVFAPHAGTVVWTGTNTVLGSETPIDAGICRSGGWHHGALIRLSRDEYVAFFGLTSILVGAGDVVAAGDLIGSGGASVTLANPAISRGTVVRSLHSQFGRWFDPLGWGDDYTGEFRAFDPGLDPNYQRGVPSQRRIDPLTAREPECPSGCSSRYTVDDSDPGFSCPSCSSDVSSTLAFSGTYKTLAPSGSYSETASATWTALSAPPGPYSIYVRLAWMVDTNADGSNDAETVVAARYRSGDSTIVTSQKPDGPATGGWYYIGTLDYDVSPYLSLSNAAYADQGRPGNDYVDIPECGSIYVDAVMFVQECSDLSPPTVYGTLVPAATATPNCATEYCGGS